MNATMYFIITYELMLYVGLVLCVWTSANMIPVLQVAILVWSDFYQEYIQGHF